ncbi:MAG: hypothetical protein WAL71_02410 [Terriglobales bacterium]|jgi:hypothetical protein
MTNLPEPRAPWRFPRAHLDGNHPIVLRFPNGQRFGASLKVISATGGLLSLTNPIDQGSQVRVMFVTESGAVDGGAEMLRPVAQGLQPFRFVSLPADEQRRIGALVGQSSTDKGELVWMEKLRAASAQQSNPPFWRFKLAGAIALLMIGLATSAYLLHFNLLR